MSTAGLIVLFAALALLLAADKPPPPPPLRRVPPAHQTAGSPGPALSPAARRSRRWPPAASATTPSTSPSTTTMLKPPRGCPRHNRLAAPAGLRTSLPGGCHKPAAGAELNCFVCHLAEPDNAARLAELAAGRAAGRPRPRLAGTGLVQRNGTAGSGTPRQLLPTARVSSAAAQAGRRRAAPTAACAMASSTTATAPLALSYSLRNWSTETTGQVYSPQRISDSALNLQEKDALTRPWDIHAERMLGCSDCHYAPNNPSYRREPDATKPEHLRYDPRKLTLGQYLKRPGHDFAKGDSAQGLAAAASDGSMRRCADCHDAQTDASRLAAVHQAPPGHALPARPATSRGSMPRRAR